MTPISGASWGKLFVYAISVLPTVLFPLNIIPVLFLAFGLYMTQRTRDFGHITAAGRNVQYYLVLGFGVTAAVFVYFVIEVATGSYLSYTSDEVLIPGLLAVAILLYIIETKYFFIAPLVTHREWIETQGLLPNRATPKPAGSSKGLRLFGTSRFKRYSVADELSKWSKLHEDGRIDAEEFTEIKRRLMGK